jgi:hypothetical protein
MTDTPIDMGMVSDTTQPSAPAPAAAPSAPPRATPGTPEWRNLSDAERHAQLRGPENPRARGHSPARDHREEVAAREAAPQDRPAADPAAPAAASTEKQKIGAYEISESELAEMMQRQAQDNLRRATLPTTPDGYKLALPEGTTLPGNIAVQFDALDPGMVAARNWAHARGIDQQGFSEVLAIYASHVAQQEASLAERSRAEIAKAGANGPQRVDAVGQWITALVGEADAKPIRATLVTDAHLRFYEKLMTQHSSQGTAPFSQQHRVAPEANKIPGYENMSFEQRRYAQEQRAARRG